MDPILLFKIILWIEPIYAYAYEVLRFGRNYKGFNLRSSKSGRIITPAKFIRDAFKMGRNASNWFDYLYNLYPHLLFYRIPILYIVYILTEVFDKGILYYCIPCVITYLIPLFLQYPYIIKDSVITVKTSVKQRKQRKQKKKKKEKEKRTFTEYVHDFIEIPKMIKKDGIIDNLISDLSSALFVPKEGTYFRKKSDVEKIDAIFANYPDFYYECKENEKGRLKFSVYSKEDNTVIYEAPVKNK